MVIRTTRAQTLVYDYPLVIEPKDQIEGDDYHENKRIFILAYQEGNVIQDKIMKIMKAFDDKSENTFKVEIDRLVDEHLTTALQKEETREIIKQTKMVFRNFLITADKKKDADVSVFQLYKLFIQREKSIYQGLNMMHQERDANGDVSQIYQALCWIPSEDNIPELAN